MTAWMSVKLGEVADFVRGINFKPEDVVPVGAPGSLPCMRTKNVQAELDLSDLWAVGEAFVRRPDQFLQPGDTLVSSANSWNLVGKCCWIPELPWRATFGGFVSVLRPDRSKVDPRFLFRWFASDRIQTTLRSFGRQTTNISNLNIGLCLGLPLPLPPLAEQRRIAEVLDRVDALRAKRRAAIAQIGTLTRAMFLDLFGDPATNPRGWSRVELRHVVDGKYGVKAGPFGSSLRKEEYTTSGYRVYGQEQVIAGRFDIGDYFIGERKFEQLKACAVNEGDVLISLVGSFGKVLVVPPGVEPGIINPRLLKIRPDSEVLTPDFLAAMLTLPSVQLEFKRMAHGGTMGVLNAGALKHLPVVTPPLVLQREYSVRAAAAVRLTQAHRASLVALDELFNALAHRAFRGEL